MSAERSVVLSRNAAKLAGKGRVWFYRDDLDEVAAEHGQIVRVRDARGHDHGVGLYSSVSRIALRVAGPWPGDGAPDPEPFFGQRIAAAIARRAALLGPRAGVRLVHAEADDLPGLVVDRYADCLVVQITSAALEEHVTAVVPALVAACEPRMVLARNDLAVRDLEQLPRETRLLHGRRIERIEIEEGGIVLEVDPFTGQKTGLYLDQRRARATVGALAAGRRGLDLFCYQGGFALAALRGGATAVVAVDQSAESLARAARGAERNGLAGLETRQGNAFDVLRELRAASERFDLVVVDPPAFAKSRRELDGALRGYRELNRQALRVLAPGGVLLTCSCSHHVGPGAFEAVLRQAAAELPFPVFLRARVAPDADHPIRLTVPESEYLKAVVLERG